MLPVVLSSHAAKRCRRRGVDPAKVIRDCRKLPPVLSAIEWTFPSGYTVIVNSKQGKLVVVTVYWPKARRGKRVQY